VTDTNDPAAVEICNLDAEQLDALAKKTFILITTVGPYGRYGNLSFKACAENGTHYLDVTGELPWVYKMLKNYESTAKATGAMMFPQFGIESAPADLVTWTLAKALRTESHAQTRDVTLSIHNLRQVLKWLTQITPSTPVWIPDGSPNRRGLANIQQQRPVWRHPAVRPQLLR